MQTGALVNALLSCVPLSCALLAFASGAGAQSSYAFTKIEVPFEGDHRRAGYFVHARWRHQRSRPRPRDLVDFQQSVSFVYKSGEFYELAAPFPDLELFATEARGINDAGTIVGRAFGSQGVTVSFLAQPTHCD